MRRTLAVFITLAVLLAAAAAVMMRVPAVQDRLVRSIVTRTMTDTPDFLFKDDAMRVLLCGSSSPFPDRTRARPCVAVFAGGKFYVVDTGTGSWNNLAVWRVPGDKIGAIFLTHYHSDHIGELGEFNLQTWVAGRPGPLQVFGPPGVGKVVEGFNQAYELDHEYRIAHHGADFLPRNNGLMLPVTVPVSENGEHQAVALRDGNLVVTAFLVDHDPVRPAVGYRFDYRGRSAVISGDTIKTERLIEAAKGADVLFHEAQAQHMVQIIQEVAASHDRPRIAKIMGDIQTYHSSPVQAAEAANEAGVKLLVLYHLTPPPPNRIAARVFLRGVDEVRPKGVILGTDGLVVELPIDSKAVHTTTM